MRTLSYAQALNEACIQVMRGDPRVFVIGQGVTSPWYVGSTTAGLLDEFGAERVIDTPVSENGITGAAAGAALAGMRPVVIHPRMDFMYYAMDQIINQAAHWHSMFGGRVNVPLTIRGIINRGGEQSAQHSQALQSIFAHVPGLKVVMPGTPYDAKGLLIASIQDGNPVIFIDDRWLYDLEGDVPEEMYTVPIGKGIIRRKGGDITVAAASYMAQKALEAAEKLEQRGIGVEVLDLRSVKPLDEALLLESLGKTGRLVVADGGWKTCGVAAEISALAATHAFDYLKAPILRVTLPDAPAPSSKVLEKAYYPDENDIILAVERVMEYKKENH